MTKQYMIMVSITAGDDTYEEEYTGNIYTDYNEARKEFLRAKNDVNVECAYIETLIK